MTIAAILSVAGMSNANAFDWFKPKGDNGLTLNTVDIANAGSQGIAKSIAGFFGKNELQDTITQELKLKAIYDYAFNLAVQSSVRSNMGNINQTIQNVSRELDAIYNFEPLMIHGKVVPPVITEANTLYHQDNPYQIRLTDRVYDIKAQARFSSTAPNWRDYLNFPDESAAFDSDVFLTKALAPKGKREKEVWAKATKKGWELGQRESNKILLDAFDRLNRDYTGMIKFHQLVIEGRIDMPAVRSYDLYNTNEGMRLLMGEKLFNIEKLPAFITPDSTIKEAHTLGFQRNGDVEGRVVKKPVALDKETYNKNVHETKTAVLNDKPIVNKPEHAYLQDSQNLKISITRFEELQPQQQDYTPRPQNNGIDNFRPVPQFEMDGKGRVKVRMPDNSPPNTIDLH